MIRKNDRVIVLSGRDKGKKGRIARILAKKSQVVIKGINLVKKHIKAQGKDQPGGIIELEKPLPIHRVALFCSSCQQGVRVGWQIDKAGDKHRVCRRCGKLLEKKGK